MPDKYPDVIPMIAYADGVAALEWLSRAFGFVERARHGWRRRAPRSWGDGGWRRRDHACHTPARTTKDRRQHRQHCVSRRASGRGLPYIIDGALVYVADVDAHFARAEAGRRRDPLGAGTRPSREALWGGGPRGPSLDVHAAGSLVPPPVRPVRPDRLPAFPPSRPD